MHLMSKKIGIVSAYYLPHLGGVEQFTDSLAHELVRMGHLVKIVTCGNTGHVERQSPCEGIEVFRLPGRSLLGDRFPMLRKGSELAGACDQIAQIPLDGMLINTRFYGTTPLALELGRRMGIRPFVLDHGSSYVGFGIPGVDSAVHAYERWMTRRAKAYDPDFYGISDRSVEWLRTFGIEAAGVIHNAIDVHEFDALASNRDFRAELGIAPNTLLAAFTGRMVVTKGIQKIADVARELEAQGANVAIVMAGDGPDKNKVQKAAPPNVKFVGRLAREDVSALLHQANLFLFPSDTEGLPTSLLEACASGISAISTNVGGVRELMPNDQYGIVLDSANVGQMVEHVLWCNEHRDVLAQRGAACRELVMREFSWTKTAQATLDACEYARRAL